MGLMMSPSNEETAETNTAQSQGLTLEQHMQNLQMGAQSSHNEEYKQVNERLSMARQ